MSHTSKAGVNSPTGETAELLQSNWASKPYDWLLPSAWLDFSCLLFFPRGHIFMPWSDQPCWDSSSPASRPLAALSEPPGLMTAEGSKRQRR